MRKRKKDKIATRGTKIKKTKMQFYPSFSSSCGIILFI